MKKSILLIVFFHLICVTSSYEYLLHNFRSHLNPDVQKKAAEGVLMRLLKPQKAKLFHLNILKTINSEQDAFHIFKSENDKQILVSGTNGLSLVWGVHYYLKNYCNIHISWDGDQLNIPVELPSVNITVTSIDKFRYYQNSCTSSYSFVWWDWRRWEREIDWMALNGINLALAFTGQEAIWQRVYDALGLVSNNFTGPAFLAWNRMGNLRNWGYGLPENWLRDQVVLQHKVLKRMRELDIVPVLPAFCGIVPRSFNVSYPLANLTKMSGWGKFSDEYCCPYFLNPSDPLFSIVSRVFMREYVNEFGTNHIYNCDTFNENIPASGDPKYLSSISNFIYNEISNFDPDAVWMIQGWMFIDPFWINKERAEAFIKGVPLGKMLILDLQSDLTPQYERLNSYYGQPFIWCTLLNFGGQLGMYGHLERINKEILKGRTFENSSMVGVGITPEGIDQNYLVYEFTLESALRSEPANLTDWVSQYAKRRYGVANDEVIKAWQILKDTAYNYRPEVLSRHSVNGVEPTTLLHGEHISKNILTRLPSLKMNELSWYNRSRIFDVFLNFLSASKDEEINSSELFYHDFIDVTRQTVQFAISSLYYKLVSEYVLLDLENFQKTSETFLNILDELDVILGSGKKFLLGKWLEDAKSCAKNQKEAVIYEFNARNQITLWGPNGEIRDYAAKQWSGLIADYYKPRWTIFLETLNKSLIDNTPFNFTATKEIIFLTIEKPFSTNRKIYPNEPRGDAIEIINEFYKNWEDRLYEIFKNFTFDKYEVKCI